MPSWGRRQCLLRLFPHWGPWEGLRVSVEQAGTRLSEEVGLGFSSHLAIITGRGRPPTPPLGGK